MTSETLHREAKLIASVASAIVECDEETQEDILELAKILSNETATVDEKDQAGVTLKHLLWPHGAVNLADTEFFEHSSDAKRLASELQSEEESFSKNLARIMKAKHLTQTELASKIGVGQPAIANMLARECRPQYRTIAKLAQALEVKPEDLWSDFKFK